MCDCIEKYQGILKEKFGGSVEVEVAYGFMPAGILERPKPMYFRYHPKKADGTESKKWQRSFLVFNYCPFCGVKYPKGD